MGRRILAFFLGMIFGIILVLGALAGGLFIAATVIKPKDIYPDSTKFLGDLAGKSLWDIYKSVSALYNDKVGVTDENGKYFTLGQFCEHYNINPNELFGGKQVPQEVLDVPVFELIKGDKDKALEQVKVSVIPALINMYTGKESEDGSANAMFPDSVLEKLSAHSVTELKDGMANVFAEVYISEIAMGMLPLEQTEDNTLLWALGQSKLGPLLGGIQGKMLLQFKEGGAFETLGNQPLVTLLGNTSQILNALFKSNALKDLVDENGDLNPDLIINSVYLGELLGLQRAPITEEQLENFVETEHANDDMKLLYCEETQSYALQTKDGAYAAKNICRNEEEEHEHTLDCYGFVWYSATATETHADTDLVLEELHYPLATGMYAALADVTMGQLTSGDSNALLNKVMNVPLKELLEGQEMSGIFANLADMTISELINGGIDDMYLGQLLGYELNEIDRPAGEITELYKNDPKQDGEKVSKYLIENEDGTVAGLSMDGKTWYEGELVCTKEEHTHTSECHLQEGGAYSCGKTAHTHNVSGCYGFVWYEQCTEQHEHEGELVKEEKHFKRTEGLMAKLSNKQISDLSSLNDMLLELTLQDVLGDSVPDILNSLKDVPIGELNDAINDMYLGDLLSFRRRPLTDDELSQYANNFANADATPVENVKYKIDAEHNVTGYAKLSDEVWYEAQLNCIEEEHVHSEACRNKGADGYVCGKTEHLHTDECFGFVWYKKCEDSSPEHSHDGEWIPQENNEERLPYVPAEGMMGKLADEQVKNLGNLDETAKRLTLGDVMGDDIPGILQSLKDVPIGKLDGAIDNLYLGQLLEYRRKDSAEIDDFEGYVEETLTENDVVVVKSNGTGYVRLDGETWYEASFTCTNESEAHTHTAACYGYVWYKLCDTQHNHAEEGDWLPETSDSYYTVADGMMGKLANEKVSNLGNLNETVQTFTLYDVLGDSVPDMLVSIKDTPISGLNDAINGMYLGDLLKYKRRPVTELESYTSLYADGSVEVRQREGAFAMTDDGENWYEAAFICDEEHTHGVGCYGFVWYEAVEGDHEHSESEWVDDVHRVPVTGMMGKLAREKVGNLGNLNDTVQNFTLQDVLGESVPDMLKSIKDTKIKNLNEAINGMYLGDFLEYRRRSAEELGVDASDYTTELEASKDETGAVLSYAVRLDDKGNALKQEGEIWYEARLCCTDVSPEHTHKSSCYGYVWYKACNVEHDHDGEWLPKNESKHFVVADGMMGKLADEKVSNLGDLNSTIQTFTLRDVMGDNIPASLLTLADTPIGNLGQAIDSMYLGSFLQYRRKSVSAQEIADFSATSVDGVMQKQEGKTVVYAMRDGTDWFVASNLCGIEEHVHDDATCKKDEHNNYTCGKTPHPHTAACFGITWYEKCGESHSHEGEWIPTDDNPDNAAFVPAENLLGRMSRLKINELNGENISNVVNDTPLGDVLTMEKTSNGLLKELATVKIGDLSDELDAVYVGIAMSYRRQEVQRTEDDGWTWIAADTNKNHNRSDEVYKDGEGNYYIHDKKHDTYYKAQLTCRDKTLSHEHTFTCFGYIWYNCPSTNDDDPDHVHGTNGSCQQVKGLSEKLSNLRIDDLNGNKITALAESLTVLDLIDSKMMDLDPDNVALLSIIFEKNESHGCSLIGYITSGQDAVTYWKNCSGHNGSAPTAEHGLEWQEMLLQDFIGDLLDAITSISGARG